MILPQAQPTRRLWQQLRPARVVQADNLMEAAAANGEGENVVNLSILTWRKRMEEEPSVMEEEVNAMEEEDRGGDDVTAIEEAGIEQLSWLVCLIGTWRQGIANLMWVLFLTLFISYFFGYNWQYVFLFQN